MDPSLPRPLSSQQLIEEEYNIHGVGRPLRLLKQNPNFDGVDPYFWEHGIAGGTAFMVWEASWTLIELLKLPPWREAVHGATVVELGSGCGLVSAAHCFSSQFVRTTVHPSPDHERPPRSVICDHLLRAHVLISALMIMSALIVTGGACHFTTLPMETSRWKS